MKPVVYLRYVIAIGAVLSAWTPKASAQDVLKVSSSERGAWELAVPELGHRAGIFKKHGIELELIYTESDYETYQGVMFGNIDVGLGLTTTNVLRAYNRGISVRIIGANVTGAPNYWYVLATSPLKTIKDLVGRTIAYASNGSASHYDALDFSKEFRLNAKLAPTGGLASTFRELTAKHVDVAWAAPPFGIDEIEQGKIRVIARANEVGAVRGKTISVLITNAVVLEQKKDLLARFMQGYRETIDWMYSDPAALGHYATFAGVSEGVAQRLRDEFFTKGMLSPDKITGLKAIVKEAKVALSRRQVSELVQIPAHGSSGLSSWRKLFSR